MVWDGMGWDGLSPGVITANCRVRQADCSYYGRKRNCYLFLGPDSWPVFVFVFVFLFPFGKFQKFVDSFLHSFFFSLLLLLPFFSLII